LLRLPSPNGLNGLKSIRGRRTVIDPSCLCERADDITVPIWNEVSSAAGRPGPAINVRTTGLIGRADEQNCSVFELKMGFD